MPSVNFMYHPTKSQTTNSLCKGLIGQCIDYIDYISKDLIPRDLTEDESLWVLDNNLSENEIRSEMVTIANNTQGDYLFIFDIVHAMKSEVTCTIFGQKSCMNYPSTEFIRDIVQDSKIRTYYRDGGSTIYDPRNPLIGKTLSPTVLVTLYTPNCAHYTNDVMRIFGEVLFKNFFNGYIKDNL